MAEADASRPRDRVTDRVMHGETPLQALARQPRSGGATALRSIERFPYYTAYPFAWYRACHAEDLAPGAVLPLRYLGRDLVAWRGEDGAPHVVDAYCPHLGAHLGYGGRVEGCELICPFHWWRFGADGANTRVPYDGTRHPSARLHVYPTIERAGLVLFWYHPAGAPPLWEIPELDVLGRPGWTGYHRALWNVRAPWQEMAENGPDFIHLRTVHGAVEVPELESYELDGYQMRLRSKVSFTTPRGPQAGRIDTDGWGPGFSLARFSGIVDACFVSAMTPIDFERTEVSFNYSFRRGEGPEAARAERVGAALIADLERQEAEDIAIFDFKIYQPAPCLSRADGPIARFRRWAAQFYVEGDARALNR